MTTTAEPNQPASAAPTLTRRYSSNSLYSPKLSKQPPVPTSSDTAVFDAFVAAMPPQTGKTAFVTGANSGLGYHAARALAKRGASVTLLCRDVDKADDARRMIAEDGGTVEVAHLDLSSLAQVRECAAELRARHARCDLLLLNAGIMAVKHALTEDGHDVQLQTNHLGHFLLVSELMPLLLADGGAPARVVSHSSNAHWGGWPSFSAEHADGPCGGGGFTFLPLGLSNWVPGNAAWARYGQSKLCNVLFTRELQRRLEARGLGAKLLAACAHPGLATTQLFQVAAGATPMPGWHRMECALASNRRPAAVPTKRLWTGDARSAPRARRGAAAAHRALRLAQSVQDGCTPLLLAATGSDVRGGDYFGPAGVFKGAPCRNQVRGHGNDAAMAAELWTWSERACGLSSFGGW